MKVQNTVFKWCFYLVLLLMANGLHARENLKLSEHNPPRGNNLSEIAASDSLIRFPHPWTSPYTVDKQNPQSLVNREGKHLYILNKTEWAFFVCDYPEQILKKAHSQGVNVIRVCLEGTPYFKQLGYDIWPWGGTRMNPDWSTFSETYWNQVEERIKLAGENGIGIDLVLYFTLKPTVADTASQLFYWKQVLKRLGKYSNILTWEIMNEYVRNESFQNVAGNYFYNKDYWKRPVCTSDGTTDDAVWPDKHWMGLSIVHTCTGSTEKHDLANWYLSVARNARAHGKPAFNNESGREKRHKNDDPVHRRKQGWLFSSAGCFWTFHAWEGCEGINDTVYNGPGAEYLLPMKQFFDSVPFWQMRPNFTACQLQNNNFVFATLSKPDREVVSMYICSRETGKTVSSEKVLVRLPDGKYNISFYNPADLRLLETLQLESISLGLVSSIQLPNFTDDLVLKITSETQKEKTLIKGTQ